MSAALGLLEETPIPDVTQHAQKDVNCSKKRERELNQKARQLEERERKLAKREEAVVEREEAVKAKEISHVKRQKAKKAHEHSVTIMHEFFFSLSCQSCGIKTYGGRTNIQN